MRNYSASSPCSAPHLTANASIALCLQNVTEHLSQYTSPVKEFWEYVIHKKRKDRSFNCKIDYF
jgi:hypothetical protein